MQTVSAVPHNNELCCDSSISNKAENEKGLYKMKSIYEALARISDECKAKGQMDYVNTLNGICDEIDTLDNLLEELEQRKKIRELREKWYGDIGC